MAKHLNTDQAKQIANAVIAKVRNKGYAVKGEIVYNDFSSALKTAFDAKAAASDLTTVSGKVDTLVGTDTSKSARSIAAEEVAKVVAGADTSFDTLKEIADWIQNDTTGAAAMANDIEDLQDKTELGTYVPEGESEAVEYGSVKDYVEAYVAEQIGDAALTEGDGIDINNGTISAKIDTANANGLGVTSSGLKIGLATQSAAGAMSAEDKLKLDQADVTAYTEGNGINISNHSVAAKIDTSNANGLDVGANGLKVNLATADTWGGVAATGTYVAGTTYYTTSACTTVVDTSDFVAGTTDVSSYFVKAKTADGTNGAMTSAEKYKLSQIEFATPADITALIASLDSLDPVTP